MSWSEYVTLAALLDRLVPADEAQGAVAFTQAVAVEGLRLHKAAAWATLQAIVEDRDNAHGADAGVGASVGARADANAGTNADANAGRNADWAYDRFLALKRDDPDAWRVAAEAVLTVYYSSGSAQLQLRGCSAPLFPTGQHADELDTDVLEPMVERAALWRAPAAPADGPSDETRGVLERLGQRGEA